jgi:hypothetical protein
MNQDVILPSWIIFNHRFSMYKHQYSEKNFSREEFLIRERNLLELMKTFNANLKDTNHPQKDIYYSLKDHDRFNIIGADMFAGSWTSVKVPNYYYWNFK